MKDYESIENFIREARMARSAYMGQLVSDTITSSWNGTRRLAAKAFSTVKASTRNNVFTFEL